MTLKQTAKNNMYKAVLSFFITFKTVFASYVRAAAEIAKFTANNEKLNGYINQQAGTSKGATDTKNNAFTNMVELIIKACRKALVYAIDNNNDELRQLFDVQEHDFDVSGTKALSKAENIFEALEPLSGELDDYRVTAKNITDIGKAIGDYQATTGTPENAQAASEAGTKGIEATMPLMDANLSILDDLIVHGIDDVDVVNAYREVRKTKVVGTRHTGLMATINDAAGKPIEGAEVLVQELKKHVLSDILGVADIESMKPGMYHVIISAPGYATQTQILKIEQGKTLEETVVMVKEVG